MRTRNKRQKRRELAKRVQKQLAKESTAKPAQASKYLHPLDAYQKQHPDMQALIYDRVSARTQDRNGNLNAHEKALRQELKKRKIPVVGCYREVGSGWILNEERDRLLQAVHKAKENVNTGIVATSTDRFLRNRDFTTDEPDLLPTDVEFGKLKELTCGVPLVTLLHPDTPSRKVRSYQTKWGQSAKKRKGGRPRKKIPGYKKKRRMEKLDRVLRLQRRGRNPSQIARMVGIARSTICDWIEKY